ncbi:sigma-70 family RNA polymerase sigma factor [bacterium]|nr:sigma-70 family RNA polymerase sigma factor [candidate division CSSED10-310 bacterium]
MRFSDEELMVMFAAGTTDAFTMLYERYRHRVFRFAVACLGSPADAEDAVQDVFLRVAGAADKYQPADRFRSWLFQISANRIRDIGRNRKRWDMRNHSSKPLPDPGDRGRFEQRLVACDTLQRLLAGLQPEDKILVLLKELEGLDGLSIAGIMGLTPEAVRVRLHRIRAVLKSAGAVNDQEVSKSTEEGR